MKWTISFAAAALLSAFPANAQTIPMEAATCPFELLMADEELAAGLEAIDGKYGLSKAAEDAVNAVVGTCALTNGWSAETAQFSGELVTTAFIVTELEDVLVAANIPVAEYTLIIDELNPAELQSFAGDLTQTAVAAKAKAKLAGDVSNDIAVANMEMLMQYLQGDARGKVMAMRIATDGLE